jgi:hypothetical protein
LQFCGKALVSQFILTIVRSECDKAIVSAIQLDFFRLGFSVVRPASSSDHMRKIRQSSSSVCKPSTDAAWVTLLLRIFMVKIWT